MLDCVACFSCYIHEYKIKTDPDYKIEQDVI